MQNYENNALKSGYWTSIFRKSPEESELTSMLKELPSFNKLSAKEMRQLIDAFHHRQYKNGEFVFHQDDPGIGLYFILEGNIGIELTTPKENTILLAQLKRGDFFGEVAMVEGETRTASAIAKSPSKLAVIFKPDFEEFLQRNQKSGIDIILGITKIVINRLRSIDSAYIRLYDDYMEYKEVTHGTELPQDTRTD